MIWLQNNWTTIGDLLVKHLLIVVPAILASMVIALPVGWFAHRFRRWGGVLLTVSGLLYTIPALPMLIMIPVIISIPLRSSTNLIVTLTLYGLALLASPAADALGSVPAATRQAATALGYGRGQMFWRLDLPLALPVFLPAARVMAMSTVGLATIGSLIGIPTLGNLLTDGFQRGIAEEVGAGIVATVLVAIVMDLALRALQWALVPWQRGSTRRRSPASLATAPELVTVEAS